VRVVLQRVRRARVTVGEEVVGEIGAGLLALVGVESGDTAADADALGAKTARLRLFASAERPFDLPLTDVPGGALLCVSQFTLTADVRRGNRPSWSRAARPEDAEPLVAAYAAAVAAHGVTVAHGRFGAAMLVEIENDGPVTLVLDCADPARPQAERAALGVAADRPAPPGVHDRAAELGDARERAVEVVDREVGQRGAVARARGPRVDAHRGARARGLPALPLVLAARDEGPPEHALPEPQRAGGVVGGELDEQARLRGVVHARDRSGPAPRGGVTGGPARTRQGRSAIVSHPERQR
jgi:D-aminoacyl-tRNA deacylase